MANINSRRFGLILCCFLLIGFGHSSYGENVGNGGCPVGCRCYPSTSYVDCSGLNFTAVPPGLGRNTTKLDLSMNYIERLPPRAFSHLPHLEELRLCDNQLSQLPATVFEGLDRLKTLLLQVNYLTEVPAEALQNLSKLVALHIDANHIKEVPAHSFKGLTSLKQLWMDDNMLSEIPVEAINKCPTLENLELGLNNISVIPDYAFVNLSRLMVLMLHDNKIEMMGDHALDGLEKLMMLKLINNKLSEFPVAISSLRNLTELLLKRNNIEYIKNYAYAGNPISDIDLTGNPIQTVGKHAFSNMPKLKRVTLSEASDLIEFPDFTGSNNIITLQLDRASILSLPDNLCELLPNLKSLDLHSNKIVAIPNLSGCKELGIINLGGNEITSLEGKLLNGLSKLKDLTLNNNYITHIPADAFIGLTGLEYLDLNRNSIKEIDPEAFVPISTLNDLNLSENEFSVLPTLGLEGLTILKTAGTELLHDFPPVSAFPEISRLRLAYAYHCCEFLEVEPVYTEGVGSIVESVDWRGSESQLIQWTNMTRHYWGGNMSIGQDMQGLPSIDYYAFLEGSEYNTNSYLEFDFIPRQEIECTPKPGPFTPCDDLFGWWALRIGVWVVFLLALFGNGTVIFVIVVSRTKMCVPRFLICNLACADFFMSIYLGFLAIIDASTLGDFKKYALMWQHSSGCQIAGFLAVLSSELSVYTLAVITMERHYAITHAMHLNKRLTLKTACMVMAGGWILALLCATLPLLGFSSYSKFAVCLPFETENVMSLAYVMAIMTVNALAFCIIVGCYLKMYCSIRAGSAWNSNDSRVAKRMALLVFTDFACWAPIAFFSITSMFHAPLISLNGAKVLTIFVLPMNSCANPFLYAIFTKQFKKDCGVICRRLEEKSTMSTRSLTKLNSSKHHSSSAASLRQVSVADKGRNSVSCSNGLPPECYQQLMVVKTVPNDYATTEEKPETSQNQALLDRKNFGDIPLVAQHKACGLTDSDDREW
ncbi:thyrotropin receptor-like [Glandiceps talaboti]